MAVKTITIDMEAYSLLAGKKSRGESFSQVIKRLVRRHGGSAASLRENLRDICLDPDALDSVEKVVRSRDSDLDTAARLE
jgi:predicted CopG family antitoxin